MNFFYFRLRSFSLGLLTSVLLVPVFTHAASTNYGHFVGTTVTYLNVTESSGTDPIPLFGVPVIGGNTLDFNPQNFSASASGAGGIDLTDGQLNLTIAAHPGNAIPFIQFSEQGDFTLIGGGTANTWVQVSANFYIDILKVDGVAITPVSVSANMTFSPNANGQFNLLGNSGVNNFWSGAFSFDVNSALVNAGVNYVSGATEIRVNLDNALAALSESGTVAFIAKKDFKGLGITVPEVPEPSIFALTLCAAGLLFARRSGR